MKTRKQYMGGECSHEEYYSQFVTDGILDMVEQSIGRDAIKAASWDKHFNSIPLGRWDCLAGRVNACAAQKLRECGDGLSLAGGVCIAKAAARMIAEGKAVEA